MLRAIVVRDTAECRLARLALRYRRAPGTTRLEGFLVLRNVALKPRSTAHRRLARQVVKNHHKQGQGRTIKQKFTPSLFPTQGAPCSGNFLFGASHRWRDTLGERVTEPQETMAALAAAVRNVTHHAGEPLLQSDSVRSVRAIALTFGT